MPCMQTQVKYQWQKKEIDDLQNAAQCEWLLINPTALEMHVQPQQRANIPFCARFFHTFSLASQNKGRVSYKHITKNMPTTPYNITTYCGGCKVGYHSVGSAGQSCISVTFLLLTQIETPAFSWHLSKSWNKGHWGCIQQKETAQLENETHYHSRRQIVAHEWPIGVVFCLKINNYNYKGVAYQ